MGFIYLHIFTMFLAVAVSVGSELVLHQVAATESVVALRTVLGAVEPLGKAIPMLYGIGFLFGLIAAITVGFNLLAPWLLMAYALFVVTMALGARTTKWATLVGRAVATNQGDTPSPELQQLLADKRARQMLWINLIVVALIVFLMVFKPFGV